MNKEINLLKAELRKLRMMVAGMMAIMITMICFSFTGTTRFSEITAERINIVEKNGDLKLVISNSALQHPGRINGKDLDPRKREAGMIFFNGDGDECGGLVYDNDKQSAGMVYSIDKYREDQVMQLQYMEELEKKERKYGLQFWTYGKENAFDERMTRFKAYNKLKTDTAKQRAMDQMKKDGLLSTGRMFVGKTYQDEMGLFINDANGKPRIRLYVDKSNQPRIELLDEKGNAIPLAR